MEWDTIFHLRILKKNLLILYEFLQFIFGVLGPFNWDIKKECLSFSFTGLGKRILNFFLFASL
jgi:hypothetical protein